MTLQGITSWCHCIKFVLPRSQLSFTDVTASELLKYYHLAFKFFFMILANCEYIGLKVNYVVILSEKNPIFAKPTTSETFKFFVIKY